MATVTRETERKYDAPAGAALPDLRGLPKVAAQSSAEEVLLEATYHDTEGFDLARAGISLRRRTGGGDAGWHLKIPTGDAATRTELRLPLGPEVPAEFLGLLTARLRGRPLRPVATISTRRRRCTLADAAGDPLAEIALDAVTAAALGGAAEPVRWTEVEVELTETAANGAALLKAADRALRRNGLTPSASRMKLEAALGDALAPPAAPFVPGGKTGAGEVVVDYLRTQFRELLTRDVLVRRAQPDAVHRMRVAARRMRAALQEFGRLFRDGETEPLIDELRWLGLELGRARDEEVLRDLILDQLAQTPAESVLGPVRARVTGHFAPRLADAERHVVDEVLVSRRYLALLQDLEDFTAHPPFSGAAGRRASRELPRLVRRSQRRVRRRMSAARRAASGSERDSALHAVRKAAKRARYAAEVAAAASGKPARKSAKAFKRLQSTLGDHHDAAIAAAELRALAIRSHGEGENAYSYGILHGRLQERSHRLARRAREEWRRADRPRRTAWMG